MAGVKTETTVAAPQRPFLRESVNAAPGAGEPVVIAAKVGNATLQRQRLDALLASLIKEYPLRQFLVASTALTPPHAFGSNRHVL